jgi:low affinity Fe/Cu permease
MAAAARLFAQGFAMPSASRKKTSARKPSPPSIPEKSWFAAFAQTASRWAGKPITFLLAAGLVVLWALSGPLFGFSETWQLVINTTTTIITFLMVFLIQSSQNRDTLAIQVKLAEIILRMPGAPDQLADAEDMSEKQLDELHEHYKERAKTKGRASRR